MKIQPIAHKSLSEIAAGKLVASILDGSLASGAQLPPERELMNQLKISRSTLREALKTLEKNNLIESRPHVGWFARAVNESNMAQAREMAGAAQTASRPAANEPPTGPLRIPIAPDKPIHIPNLKKDRLGTFEFISWWEREKVKNAKVMVIGAGALGNEVIKNLSLMGIGNLFIVDFDKVEAANLSRSILFREADNNRSKAEIAAARAKSINPDIHVQYLNGDVTTQLGLGIFRRMDVIIGCLDNREARLAVNRFCYWVNKPWVDGAIQELLGLGTRLCARTGSLLRMHFDGAGIARSVHALFLSAVSATKYFAWQGSHHADHCFDHRRDAVAGSAQTNQRNAGRSRQGCTLQRPGQ